MWFDFIRRSLIASGELQCLIDEDALGGVTSNPAIFEKAIDGSDDYKAAIEEIATEGLTAKTVYERFAVKDIQDAADTLRPVYDRTHARDGYVSLEVAPDLANDTAGTLEEARRLWSTVSRPNVMVKVPATPAGLPAIRTLISEGININVTLLFARDAYEAVAHAYLEGLEALDQNGGSLAGVASVASFFVSRIDSAVDALLADKLKHATGAEAAQLTALQGKVAIANAKLAYRSYQKIFSGPRWEALKKKGAQTQRVLWASTGTKNPHYRDVLYVEELIGPDTVNTMPPETLAAFAITVSPGTAWKRTWPERRRRSRLSRKAGISLEAGYRLAARGRHQEIHRAIREAVEGCGTALPGANHARINAMTHVLPSGLAGEVSKEAGPDWDTQGGPAGSSPETRRSGRAATKPTGLAGLGLSSNSSTT